MANKMTKEMVAEEIKRVTGELFDLELTEEQIEKIEGLQEPKKSNIKALEKMLDEALATIAEDGKKAVFKWATIEGFYKMKLQQVTPEKIQKGFKISFRLDARKVNAINDFFYYPSTPTKDFADIDFVNGQDIGTVTKIDKEGWLYVKSDTNGGMWTISPDDINGTKSTKCVIKDGTNIAFLVYAPIEK